MAILQKTGITGSLSISSSGIRPTTSASLFNVNGYNGRLLNVVDTLSGSLFSVNTIAGLPVLEVFSNNRVVAGKYAANDFVISGSRVGIGTTSPSAKLDVAGSNTNGYSLLLRSGDAFDGTDSVQIAFGYNNTTDYRHSIRTRHNSAASSGNNIDFYLWKYGTDAAGTLGSQFAMTMQGDGNVGIGTTTANSRLHVSGSIRAAGGSNSTFISIVSSGTDRYFLDCYGTSNRQIFTLYENSSNAYLNSWSNMIFRANQNGGSGGYFVFSGANVGIGTTSPDVLLDVFAGTLSSTANSTLNISTFRSLVGNASYLKILEKRSSAGGGDWTTATTRIQKTTDTTDQAYIDFNPVGASYGIAFGTGATTPTQKMVINIDGNVGIGTSSPTAKLHISSSANGGVTNVYSTLSDRGTATIYNSNIALYDDATTSTSNAIKYNYVGSYLKRKNSAFTSYNVGNFYGATNLYSGSVSSVWDFWSRVQVQNKATGSNVVHFVADSGYGGSILGLGVNRTGFLVNSQYQTAANFSNQYGLYVNDLAGATNNFGAYFAINAAANKWNVYSAGTAANFFQGNVGIGTNNPLAKLHVSSSVATPSAYFQGKVGIGSSVPETDLSVYDMNFGRVTIAGTTYYGVWLTGGNTSTDFSFLSSPSDTNLYVNAPASKGIYNQISNQNRLVVLNNYSSTVQSSFGVNMSGSAHTPLYTLDVFGTMRSTGDVGFGGAPDAGARLTVIGEAIGEPYISVNTCLGNNSPNSSFYTNFKGWLAIKIGNNVGTAGNLITAGTYYLRMWG